jgi:hypothetical protein
VTPVGQSHRLAYVSAAPVLPERQATATPVKYQVVERDGGTVWVKLSAEVTTHYPSLMQEQRPEPEWLTPMPVFDWPLSIDIDSSNRFAPWDRRISGIMK